MYIQDCSYDNNTYRVGDFVYVEPSESKLQPHIVLIERMWEDQAGNLLIMLLKLTTLLWHLYNVNVMCQRLKLPKNNNVFYTARI